MPTISDAFILKTKIDNWITRLIAKRIAKEDIRRERQLRRKGNSKR
jgi:hypothetical protein